LNPILGQSELLSEELVDKQTNLEHKFEQEGI
jgi:centrosomal protein CEP76